MGMGGNGNSPHGNPMGMGISQILGNGAGRAWKLNRWEWEGMGMLKAIPAHLYIDDFQRIYTTSQFMSDDTYQQCSDQLSHSRFKIFD